MQSCTLEHIPNHLHSLGKAIVPSFSIGEELYYRCNPNECVEPYQKISLYDISHNRNFNDSSTYLKNDVLYNIDSENPITIIPNKEIITIIINRLSNGTYEKTIINESDKNLSAKIKLLHDPIPCMYSHCVFEISINDTIITKENYNSVLNKKSIPFKNIRRDIRHELTSIIYTSSIDDNLQTEIITEL